MDRFQGLIGIVVLIGIAYLLSADRRRVDWRVVLAGTLMQALIAAALLKLDRVIGVFDALARGVTKVISFADDGRRFLFGSFADARDPWGFVFAVQVLPVIVFFASLMGVLYHLRIMQRVVAVAAWVLRKGLRVTGAEAISGAANIFVGQTEAPLTVRPYIAQMTRAQIMAIMTGGFATIAGSVLAAYVKMLGGASVESQVLFAKHLMTASVMSAPAAFVMARVMLPETESPRPETVNALLNDEVPTRNVMDAAAAGATDGLKLALNVAAMLCAFVALLAMVNWPLAELSRWGPIAEWRGGLGLPEFTLQNLLGLVFMPIAWAMGIPWADCRAFGGLLGTQIIATEFVAYIELSKHVADGTMSSRSCQIATYALCGFANIPSIAIQIGGLSALAPERRSDFASLAPRAMVAGALACWMTGAVAGVFIG